MNQQQPNQAYIKAVELWQARRTLGYDEAPPDREDYSDDDATNKSFSRTAIEAITQGINFKAQIDALGRHKSSKQFYEIAVSFEDLAIKKMELGFLSRHINIRETYLICDRLFVDLSRHKIAPSDLDEYVRYTAISNNLISLKGFRIVECNWIESILQLFMRSPAARAMQKVAEYSKEQCGHEWTFDELLARVAVGEFQESQRMSKIAQDAMQKAPPPIIIVKDEAEIERLRIQYQPKKEL